MAAAREIRRTAKGVLDRVDSSDPFATSDWSFQTVMAVQQDSLSRLNDAFREWFESAPDDRSVISTFTHDSRKVLNLLAVNSLVLAQILDERVPRSVSSLRASLVSALSENEEFIAEWRLE